MNWEDAVTDPEYVAPIVLPQMQDIVERAIAAGATPPFQYVGAGMTSVVLCKGVVAYKVARSKRTMDLGTLHDEAEWLETASTVPWVKEHVARFHKFDLKNVVIERDCPTSGRDMTPYRYGESKLWDLHQEIGKQMIPHGWSAPEFKPDSYVITDHGPVLVDASFAFRVGQRLLDYTWDLIEGRREPGIREKPTGSAFDVRNEIGRTISAEDAEEVLMRLESLGDKWSASAIGETVMREVRSSNITRAQDEIRLSNGDVMTLAHALDVGRVLLKTTEGFGRGGRLRGEVIELYIAKEVDGDLIWQVGKTLYDSRMHGSAFGRTGGARPTPPAHTASRREVERLRDRDGSIWTVLSDSRFVENEDGEKFLRLNVEAESGPLTPIGHGDMREASRSDFKKQNSLDIARGQRDRARAEIAAAKQEAADARSACSAARRAAADTCANAKTLRHKRDALVKLAREYRLIRRAELARARKGPGVSRTVQRSESDDEVRFNIPPELVPTFEIIKRDIRPNARKSRTETFLEWVESHPSEIVYVEPSDEDYERSYAQRRVGEMREDRLTPDVLPYSGAGIQSPGEYKATIEFLRAVRDRDYGDIFDRLQNASTTSNEYQGAMAALRGGLVQSSDGPRYSLTKYGRVYLEQRDRANQGMRESSTADDSNRFIDYFIFDAEDKDVGLFSRASTDEVASFFSIDPKDAYKELNALAGEGLLTKSRDTLRGRGGKKAVGYQQWEYYWKDGDLERYDAAR